MKSTALYLATDPDGTTHEVHRDCTGFQPVREMLLNGRLFKLKMIQTPHVAIGVHYRKQQAKHAEQLAFLVAS